MENRSENRYRSETVSRAMHFRIVATLTYPYQRCFLQITLFTVPPCWRVRGMYEPREICFVDTGVRRSELLALYFNEAKIYGLRGIQLSVSSARGARSPSPRPLQRQLHFEADGGINIAACDSEPFIDRLQNRIARETRERIALLNVRSSD